MMIPDDFAPKGKRLPGDAGEAGIGSGSVI
jgi:hypothetical protein